MLSVYKVTKTNLILPFEITVTSDVNFFQKVPLTQRRHEKQLCIDFIWRIDGTTFVDCQLNLFSKCVDNDMYAFSTW